MAELSPASACGALLLLLLLAACNPADTKYTVEFQATTPTLEPQIGTHELQLGATLFINRGFQWRDGLLHIPSGYRSSAAVPTPLLIWLHGGGGSAKDAKTLFPAADEFGVVVLAPDSRHNTWDGIDSPFGPDPNFIEKALRYTAERVHIDPQRITLGGLSDGASYALAIGRSNGDLFRHIVAVSAWRLRPPGPAQGQPRILVAHGRNDNVYPEWHSRHVLAPGLSEAGYDVTYHAFDGPHAVTAAAAQTIMRWIISAPDPNSEEATAPP
ncbi:MAG: phospholipase [Pseudomonadota bacterium]